jgi:hypothetical protein
MIDTLEIEKQQDADNEQEFSESDFLSVKQLC